MASTDRFYTAPQGPDVSPDTEMPRNARYEISSSPDMFGGLIAKGLSEAGKGLTDAYNVYGQVAADQATNNFLGKLTALRTDFEQTRGQDTINAWRGLDGSPGYPQKAQALFDEARGTVPGGFQNTFDNVGRRYLFASNSAGDSHFRTQSGEWAKTVATTKDQEAINSISAHPNDDATFNANVDSMAHAAVVQAQIAHGIHEGTTDPDAQTVTKEAHDIAVGRAWYTRIEAVRATNRAQALVWQKQHADELGHLGPEVANQLKAYAHDQTIDGIVAQSDAAVSSGYAARGAGGGDPSTALIRSREGFRPNAYWDVNHWRTGYGSDTVTLPDGSVRSVGKDTVVTREDAERDLQRRTQETQSRTAAQVGYGRWQALTPGAKAALTSMAYNYGLLPFDVQAAVRGGTVEDIARMIQGHAGDNGGVNRARRMQEASIALGGAIPSGGSHGSSVGEGNLVHVIGPDGTPVTSASPMSPTIPPPPVASSASAPEEGVQAQPAAYAAGDRQAAAGGPLGVAPPVQQTGMETSTDQQSAWDAVRQRTSMQMQWVMDNPDISEEDKDKALGKLERKMRNATYAAEMDASTRSRHSQEAVDRSLQMTLAGNPQGAFNALDDAFRRGLIDEPAYERGQAVIERRSGQEDTRSYGPGYHDALRAVLAAPGTANRVHDLGDLLNMEMAGQISAKGYTKLRQDFLDIQRGDNEGFHVQEKLAFDAAAKYLDWEMQGPTAATSIRNPNGPALMQDFARSFYSEADLYRKDHPDMEGFRFFDSKKLQAELGKMYPERQKTADQNAGGLSKMSADQAATLEQAWHGAPPPAGASQVGWTSVLSQPPVMANAEQSFPLPHPRWAQAVGALFAKANDPHAVPDFNEFFGPNGTIAIGPDARLILQQLMPSARRGEEIHTGAAGSQTRGQHSVFEAPPLQLPEATVDWRKANPGNIINNPSGPTIHVPKPTLTLPEMPPEAAPWIPSQ